MPENIEKFGTWRGEVNWGFAVNWSKRSRIEFTGAEKSIQINSDQQRRNLIDCLFVAVYSVVRMLSSNLVDLSFERVPEMPID